jgi:hypothetical protein
MSGPPIRVNFAGGAASTAKRKDAKYSACYTASGSASILLEAASMMQPDAPYCYRAEK